MVEDEQFPRVRRNVATDGRAILRSMSAGGLRDTSAADPSGRYQNSELLLKEQVPEGLG